MMPETCTQWHQKVYRNCIPRSVSKYKIESVKQMYSVRQNRLSYSKHTLVCVNAICFLRFYRYLYAYMYKSQEKCNIKVERNITYE